MLYNLYEYLHHTLGMHLWDLPALLVAIVTAAVLIVHSRNQKNGRMISTRSCRKNWSR